MAVKYLNGSTFYNVAFEAGVSLELLGIVGKSGVTVSNYTPGVYTISKLEGVKVGDVIIKGAALTLLLKGKLGPASKLAIKEEITALLESAIAGSLPIKEGNKVVSDKDKNDVSFMLGKKQILLEDAVECYVPVYGTSSDSVYYVVAIFTGIKMAARYKGGKLSIRITGSDSSLSSVFESFGLSVKGSYSSGHYKVDSDLLVVKTLSSLIGCIGFDKVVSVANIGLLVDLLVKG